MMRIRINRNTRPLDNDLLLRRVLGGPGDAACFGAIGAESSRCEGERNLPSSKQDERDDERKHCVPDQSSAPPFTPYHCGYAIEFRYSSVRTHHCSQERGDSAVGIRPRSVTLGVR
jgi:hypothetical protein